jgi:hypothetical protein
MTLVSKTKIFRLLVENETIEPPEDHGLVEVDHLSNRLAGDQWGNMASCASKSLDIAAWGKPRVEKDVWWLSRIGAFDFV